MLNAPHRRCSTLGLGEPAVLLDGVPVTQWRMSRTMELYFLLLESNRPVHKDKIMGALWPDEDEQNDQTLRSTVHYLRKAVGAGCVISLVGAYALDLGAVYGDEVWYDVSAFREYALLAKDATANEAHDEASRAYEHMVSLYRGDYLQTCYSDWCIPYRDTLRTAYMQALTSLAHLAWERKAYDACLDYWQRHLAIDNCLEDAHYGVMCCYIKAGKRSLALRQYHQCRETLQRELGTNPSETIESLYQKQLHRGEQRFQTGKT